MTYDEYQRPYKNQLPIEKLAEIQINRIMENRSKKLLEFYEESVDALIDLLPPEIEDAILEYKKNNSIYYDLSNNGKEKYIRLFREIKTQLHKSNIVWKRGSFEIGHD